MNSEVIPGFPNDAHLRIWQRYLREQLRAISDQPEQEARWLIAATLNLDPAAQLCAQDSAVSATDAQQLQQLLAQRLDGLPLAYCLREWSFYGHDLEVDASVLIPRPDTELLVSLALDGTDPNDALQILDLGTGSGAIALTLSLARPRATVFAVERSPAALQLARRNAAKLGASVQWREGDWYAALEQGLAFDQIVSNPPYLASHDPHLPDLRHEPQEALVAGPTGLECLDRIITGAWPRLRPGGRIMLEHGVEQGAAVRTLLQNAGLGQVETHKDIAGRERVSGAKRI